MLGRADLLLLVINVVVGAGVIALPGRAYAAAGGAIYWALAVALAAAIAIATSFAILARRFEGPGGPYLYTRRLWGWRTGAAVGWSLVVTRLLATATSLRVGAEAATAAFWPTISPPVIVLVTSLIFGVIALLGLALPIRLSNAIGAMKLVALAGIAVLGLTLATRVHAVPQPPVYVPRLGQAVLIWFYAFTGFEAGTILSADARRPRRDLPIALAGGLLLAGALYAALTVATVAMVPQLDAQTQPIVALVRIALPTAASLIDVLLVLVVAATLPAQFAIAPRLLAGMAAEGAAPRAWRAGPNGVSRPAVLGYAMGVIAAALLVEVTPLIVASTAVRLIAYAACSAGLCRLSMRGREVGVGLVAALATTASIVLLLAAVA